MKGSTIVSELDRDESMVLFINGSNYDTYRLLCNKSNVCIIHCQSEEACTFLEVECSGTCYADCQEGYIACPNGEFELWATVSPSLIPTPIATFPMTTIGSISTTNSRTSTSAPTFDTPSPTYALTPAPTIVPIAPPTTYPTTYPTVRSTGVNTETLGSYTTTQYSSSTVEMSTSKFISATMKTTEITRSTRTGTSTEYEEELTTSVERTPAGTGGGQQGESLVPLYCDICVVC